MIYGIILVALLISVYTDLKHRIIPDTVCLVIALCGLVSVDLNHVLGISLGVIMLIVGRNNCIGGGDIKLVGALGFACGLTFGVPMLTNSLVLMLLWHLIKSIRNKTNRHTAYPMAPFICAGYCMTYYMF